MGGLPTRAIAADQLYYAGQPALPRAWCRFSGSERSVIEPGSRWQNPLVESFDFRVPDELLSVEAFYSMMEAQPVINDSKDICNQERPHSSLG